MADVVDKALPSVIQVITSDGTGTGFIISSNGLVVTNRHVVAGADRVRVWLATGEQFRGDVTYRHPDLDLAHIEIDGEQTFTPIPIADYDAVRPGEEVIAIGYPLGSTLGRTPTVSIGIVSAKRDRLLQTDAALNPGNSGGPLLNARGEAVGVVVSRLETDSTGNAIAGIGFAIPINEVTVDGERLPLPAQPIPTREPGPPTATPAPTFTPLPTATPPPHPATFCREWEALVMAWIREGNSYWQWAPFYRRFEPPFGGAYQYTQDFGIPELPRLSAEDGTRYCLTDFPLSELPAGVGAGVGEGKQQLLPGTYEYSWAGGNWVEGEICKVTTNKDAKGDGQETLLPRGPEPFSFVFEPGHGRVSFQTYGNVAQAKCKGALHRIGD